MRFLVNEPSGMRAVARELIKYLNTFDDSGHAVVLGLSGDLGAGKTTFAKNFADELGVLDIVNSPTFNILKKYKITKNPSFDYLIHIDAYRLNSGDELAHLNWYDLYNNPKNVIIIEWPEKVSSVAGDDMIKINFNHVDIDKREVVMNIK